MKKRQNFQLGIESPNGEQSTIAIKEFLLPEGEGQDEGEPRLVTRRPGIFL